MHLAFEASLLQGSRTGLGQYAYCLLKELRKDPALKITLLHSSKCWHGPDFGLPTKSYHFFKESLAISFRLNKVLRELGADLYHAPGNTGVPPKADIPCVATVHDLYPLLAGSKSRGLYSFFFRYLMNNVIRETQHILCNSRQTQDELLNVLKFPKENTCVTYLGPGQSFEWHGQGDYYLCVGSIEQRKGQIFLAKRYLEALCDVGDLPVMMFIGSDRGSGQELTDLVTKSNGKIIWHKNVNDMDLKDHYKNCKMLIVPSYYEGFGLSLLEGLLSGVPVVYSDIPIFREVARDYGTIINHDNHQAWRDVFKMNLKPAKVSSEYRKEFSWQACAQKTLNIYKKILSC